MRDYKSNEFWQLELEEYIRQGEPAQIEKSEAWQTAIGLQDVDGLKTSDYLLDTAKRHIDGDIDIEEAQRRIYTYYEERSDRTEAEDETKEADIVSVRIAKLLGEKTFQFSPAEWLSIHRYLFEGVLQHAGEIRAYNITKKEWVLNGETVIYASCNSIKETLDYDFQAEKNFSYHGLSNQEIVKHLAKFASDIWQIHPFTEGNTRATAVFMIKYMRTLGFEVNNEGFEKHSWYFRNALVRANYNDFTKDIHSTTKYLEMFFSNLLLGTNCELKNRYLHIMNTLDVSSETSAIQNKTSAIEMLTSAIREKNYNEPTPTNLLKVYTTIEANQIFGTKEIAEILGCASSTAREVMKKLRDLKVVVEVKGHGKGKYRFLNKDEV